MSVTLTLTAAQYATLLDVFGAADQSHEDWVHDHRDYWAADERFYVVQERLRQRRLNHLLRAVRRQAQDQL
jgi:hypothetical protein